MPNHEGSNFRQGNAGNNYVLEHLNQLVRHGIVTRAIDTEGDYVEGGDNRINYQRFGERIEINDIALDAAENDNRHGYRIEAVLTGGVEVKTIDNFIFRNNDMNEPSGTLPFELWKNNREKLGWLLALMYPEIRIQEEDDQPLHAVQPILFSFLLVSYLGPYACIMFEDFPALALRLKELAAARGIELDPSHIPIGEEAETWRQDDPYIIGNVWHVPFEQVQDLATVTLIGDMPIVKRSLQHDPEYTYERLQQARIDYLRRCADDRSNPGDPRLEEAFYPADVTHVFADVLKNMETIEHLSEEEYPYLFQALRSRSMRDHLNCTLLNMYSHALPTRVGNMLGFLQTKTYLHKWGNANNVIGSRFSWQSHLIFLTDAGLLKKFIDSNKPLSRGLFRSVPRYTPEVLREADDKARKYIAHGIKLNNFTKSEVIRVSGQARANTLFYGDGRVISAVEENISNMFIAEANRILDEQGYALPDQIVNEVSRIVFNEYWEDPFEEAEQEQMENYTREISRVKRLKHRYLELSLKVPCQYRELTPEEKASFQLPAKFRRKVFIRN